MRSTPPPSPPPSSRPSLGRASPLSKDTRSTVPAGWRTACSAASRTARAAAMSSRAADWRWATTSGLVSAGAPFSSGTGALGAGGRRARHRRAEGHLEAVLDHPGPLHRTAAKGVGEDDGTTVGAHPDEQLVVASPHLEVGGLGERELQRQHRTCT